MIEEQKELEKVNSMKHYKGLEKELLRRQLELLAEESKHPDTTSDLEGLSDAMCNIYKLLVRNRIRVAVWTLVTTIFLYFIVCVIVGVQ